METAGNTKQKVLNENSSAKILHQTSFLRDLVRNGVTLEFFLCSKCILLIHTFLCNSSLFFLTIFCIYSVGSDAFPCFCVIISITTSIAYLVGSIDFHICGACIFFIANQQFFTVIFPYFVKILLHRPKSVQQFIGQTDYVQSGCNLSHIVSFWLLGSVQQ